MKTLLIVFLKAPEPGKVKTRLIPDLGECKATEVHLKLVTHVLDVAEQVAADQVQCWVAGDMKHPYIQSLSNRFDIVEQHGADLGARMLAALNEGLKHYQQVAIVGGDAYSLTPGYIEQAFDQLNGADVVLGPADDGGYVLIAASKTHSAMFDDISWGTETVLETQIARLDELGVAYEVLETRWDIDNIQDINKRAPELLS